MKKLVHNALKIYARSFPIAKGKNRLVALLWKPLSFGQYERQATLRQAKVKMSCDLTQMLQRHFYFFGGYEETECEHWMKLAGESKVIFDVGSNVGLYSLLAAKVNPQAQIHAFEPTPEVFQRLQENLALNHMTNVTANQVAAGKANGKIFLQRSQGIDDDNEGMNFVSDITSDNSSLSVDLISIGQYCDQKGIGNIDLMKIDVEGGEYNVLLGLEEMLQSQSIKVIFMELLEWAANRAGHSTVDIKQLLKNAGYQIYKLNGNSKIPVSFEDIQDEGNVIAVAPNHDIFK